MDEELYKAAQSAWKELSTTKTEVVRMRLSGPPVHKSLAEMGLNILLQKVDKDARCVLVENWAKDWRRTKDCILLALAGMPDKE